MMMNGPWLHGYIKIVPGMNMKNIINLSLLISPYVYSDPSNDGEVEVDSKATSPHLFNLVFS